MVILPPVSAVPLLHKYSGKLKVAPAKAARARRDASASNGPCRAETSLLASG